MTFTTRIMLMTCAAAALAVPHAAAQTFEAFGGFSGANMKPKNGYEETTMKGWNTSISAFKGRFGLTADFAGYHGTATTPAGVSADTRQYSFMGGPTIRLLRRERFSTSVRALVGAARGYADVDGGSINEQTLAALFGGNFDVHLSRKISLRFAPGVYITQFGTNQTQTNFRFSIGPVFRFGGRG